MTMDDRCLAVARFCTASKLRRATRVVARIFDEAMATSGLEGTQLTVLVTLALAGEQPVHKLAELLAVDRTTLTRNLAPLERHGWIERGAGADQRVRLVRLTERGRRTLDKALPLWEEAQQSVVGKLGKARWSELLALLKAVEALAS
jgi:DNA-binding MarR family transcriptional regulator